MELSIGPKPARTGKTRTNPVLSLIVSGLLCLSATIASAGSAPRTDQASNWTTQEWPQDLQSAEHTSLFSAPFNVPGVAPWPVSWKFIWDPSYWREPFAGPVTSEFFDLETSKTKFGPYGVFFALSENSLFIIDPKTGGNFIQGSRLGWDCRGTGPFTIIWESPKEGRLLIASGKHNCNSVMITQTFSWDIVAQWVGGVPPVIYTIQFKGTSEPIDIAFEDNSFMTHAPTIFESNMYFANIRVRTSNPGMLRCSSWSSLTEVWAVPLQVGVGLDVPLPKGEEPPPAQEVYQPLTSVAVRGDLLVVGTARSYGEWLSEEGALFAISARDGSQKWVYKVSGRIMPNPVITSNLIIFGTNKGTVYAVDYAGNLRWRTIEGGQLMYPPLVSAPNELEKVILYGPAVDSSEIYAYFGGSDGRIHRFDVQGGTLQSSDVLFFERNLTEVDDNGTPVVRPCYINSPPAISDNPQTGSFLAVKCASRNHDYAINFSLLNIVKIPTLEHVRDIAPSLTGVTVDPQGGYFEYLGGKYGAVDMSKTALSGLYWVPFDPILGTSWVAANPDLPWGDWYRLRYVEDEFKVYGHEEDTGGVSITNGMVTATDRGGNMIAVPSKLKAMAIVAPAGAAVIGPVPPYSAPFALGPVQVYPNPFHPAKAVGGTAKFKNLPAGSKVEIYTLAHEKVRSLSESGNQAFWDGKNEAGQETATGVYLYIIEIPDDKPIKGRLALIRD